MKNILIVFLLLLILKNEIIFGQIDCLGFKGEPGLCKVIENCQELKTSTLLSDITTEELLSITCGKDPEGNIKICCPLKSSTKSPCGISTSESDHPWLVAIGGLIGTFFNILCSGVLISNYQVLGSSDCTQKINVENATHVLLGAKNNAYKGTVAKLLYAVDNSKRNFDPTRQYSVSVYFLEEPVKFNEKIQPICMPNKDQTVKLNYEILNWENTRYPTFHSYSVANLVTQSIDKISCGRINQTQNRNFYERQICSYHRRFCNYKDLQPILIAKDQSTNVHSVIGISPVATQSRCKNKEIPDIFASVYYHLDWIRNQMIQALSIQDNNCGLKTAQSSSPWSVVIGREYDKRMSNSCHGVLISKYHVLVNGKCKKHIIDTNIATHVQLGQKHSTNDSSTITMLIADIKIHPKLKKYRKRKKNVLAENSIGVIKLAYPVTFNEFIQPICIPKGDINNMNYTIHDWVQRSIYWLFTNVSYKSSFIANITSQVECQSSLSNYSNLNEGHICAKTMLKNDFYGYKPSKDKILIGEKLDSKKNYIIGVAGLRHSRKFYIFNKVSSVYKWILRTMAQP